MGLLGTVNALLRDRTRLYEEARQSRTLWKLCGHLAAIFVITSGVYGGVMGAFRCFHPDYFFSNFELLVPGQPAVKGRVEGMIAEARAVYTRSTLPQHVPGATIRFNMSRPSEAYAVASLTSEKGYGRIVLAEGAALREADAWKLPLRVAVKTPLLFVLTLLVCALALYVLNLAFGMNLHFMPTMTVMGFGLAATGVLLVVFAPIALLFTAVTDSYHFMKMLHVAVFTVAGGFGLKTLNDALAGMDPPPAATDASPRARKHPRGLLAAWLVLYCVVGAQLAWTLKPFLGTPYLPETPPFRIESGNIFVSTLSSGLALGDR